MFRIDLKIEIAKEDLILEKDFNVLHSF